jgi:hypothetical protein
MNCTTTSSSIQITTTSSGCEMVNISAEINHCEKYFSLLKKSIYKIVPEEKM